MKYFFKNLFFATLAIFILSGCFNYRKLVNDEVVLKDGNSQTGTITGSDSVNIKLKKFDESILVIPWKLVDTVQGKKLRTICYGINMGYYNIPYFSMFRNEAITAKHFGMEYKIGFAYRSYRLCYLNLTSSSAKPYAITKFGLGYQYYLGKSTYLKDNAFFVGTETNLMNAKYNNSVQFTFEPFTGFEKKLNEHIRVHFKFQLQFNPANKNNNVGFNTTLGIHFLRKNFKRYYDKLNDERRLPGK